MADLFVEYPPEDLEAMGAGKNYVQWIHSIFKPHIKGAVAEVGAGIGVYSKVLLNTPSLDSLSVFEPSTNLIGSLKLALSYGDKPVQCFNSVFEAEFGKQYDTILYINVMEHIDDDTAEMETVYKALRSKGKLLVFVPALPFLYSDNDRRVGHFRRYRKKELLDKIRCVGFDIIEHRYFDSIGVLSWLICCKWMKMHPASGSVGLYDNLLVPTLRVLERFVPPMIGKNLVLVAQKK